MVSFRKRPNGGIESKDAPVASAPQATSAELPPVAETIKQPIEIETEPSPVQAAESAASKQRLAEIERAEQLVRQSSEQPRPARASPEVPVVEQVIANAAIPESAKAWLRKHPDQTISALHDVAKRQAGGNEWTDAYFERIEDLLGLKPVQSNGNGGAVQPRSSAPPRQQARQAPTVSYSAPPTRDVPSMSTGRPIGRSAPLTAAELEIAQQCGQSPEEYQRIRDKLKRDGLIGGNNGQ